MRHFLKEKIQKLHVFFSKKSLLSFLSLRYSADFRRSRLVDYYHSLVFGGKCFKRHFSCGRESYNNLDGISAGFLLRLKINSSLNMGGSFIRTSISEKLKAGISFAMGFRRLCDTFVLSETV